MVSEFPLSLISQLSVGAETGANKRVHTVHRHPVNCVFITCPQCTAGLTQ